MAITTKLMWNTLANPIAEPLPLAHEEAAVYSGDNFDKAEQDLQFASDALATGLARIAAPFVVAGALGKKGMNLQSVPSFVAAPVLAIVGIVEGSIATGFGVPYNILQAVFYGVFMSSAHAVVGGVQHFIHPIE